MGYTGPLADKDRIFTNVYGFQSPDLKAARQRGDWDDTKGLMAIGQDAIIVIVIVWKILNGLLGLLVGLAVAALVVYGAVKLVENVGTKRIK
jgi:hypothetical protein